MTDIVDIASRFRNSLSRIEQYIDNKDKYAEQMATIEEELREERDLEGILRDNDLTAFQNIRATVEDFLSQQTDLESKHSRLGELLAELRDLINRNDEGLRQHDEARQLVARVTESRLARADGIPIMIREINEFLASRGRLGKNPTFTIYSSASSRAHIFEQQITRQHIRSIQASVSSGNNDEFCVGNSAVALVKFDVPRGGTVKPGTGILSVHAAGPQTGNGLLDVFFMTPQNTDVVVEQAGRDSKGEGLGMWMKRDGSTAPLTRATAVGVSGLFNGCHFLTHSVPERQRGDDLRVELPIQHSVIQGMLDGRFPPIFVLSSSTSMRFDPFRDSPSDEAAAGLFPKLQFEYER